MNNFTMNTLKEFVSQLLADLLFEILWHFGSLFDNSKVATEEPLMNFHGKAILAAGAINNASIYSGDTGFVINATSQLHPSSYAVKWAGVFYPIVIKHDRNIWVKFPEDGWAECKIHTADG